MKQKHMIIAVAVLVVGFLLIINTINNKHKEKANIAIALANHNVEELIGKNEALQQQLFGHRVTEDSLWLKVRQYDSKIVQLNVKYRQIAFKYEIERNRVKELPDDSAVGLFLDNSDCGELPILKYDSAYLIPICPIRTYNDIKLGYEMQIENNVILTLQKNGLSGKIGQLNSIISERGQQIADLNHIVENDGNIIAEKDVTILQQKKKIRQQATRKYIWIGIGAVATTVAVIF